MLADGWQIKGFQPIVDGDQIGDGVAAITAGYTVLLQSVSDLAVAVIACEAGNWRLSGVHILTREAKP
jgi:hypothetical protein